jgi:hypothetical protein
VADAVASGEVPPSFASNLTLTRLHVRYGKGSLGEDLVFRTAPPIEGGRGVPGPKGDLPRGVRQDSSNNFQGRYVIRHPWTGPVECDNPQRGIWGGPVGQAEAKLEVATDTAFAPRGQVQLGSLLASPVPELDGPGNPLPGGPFTAPSWPEIPVTRSGGCAGCALSGTDGILPVGLVSVGAALLGWSRRRRKRIEGQ